MSMTMQAPERVLRLEGAYNVRDLGGYEAGEGRKTQWGRLFRADGLHKLTEADAQAIVGRGIRTVVDLRHAHELAAMANVFADYEGVAYFNVDLVNPTSAARPSIRSLGELYVGMLDTCQPAIARVIELLADDAGEAVLFHCTAGKDRTGVISALLLDLAGVPNETIVDDYEMTAVCIAPLMDALRADRPDMVPADIYERFLGCDRDNMTDMLAHLYDQYGGAASYLREIGVSDERIAALRDKLLGV